MQIYTEPEIYQLIDELWWWEYNEDWVLTSTYEFNDFMEAMAFVVDISEVAEELHHHPDIAIKYNLVTLSTSTHDAQWAITDKDLELIKRIEELVE